MEITDAGLYPFCLFKICKFVNKFVLAWMWRDTVQARWHHGESSPQNMAVTDLARAEPDPPGKV